MSFERRLNLHYFALQAGFWMMYAAVCAYMVSLLLERGFTDAQCGIIVAVRCFSGVVIQPLLGSFADRNPHIPLKRIVGVCLMLSFAAQALYLVHPLGLLGSCAVYAVIGGLELSAYPFLDTMAVQYINSGVNLNYSLGRGIGSFFYAIVCVLLGIQVTVFGAVSTMITHLALILLEFLLLLSFPAFQGERIKGREGSAKGAFSMLAGNPRFTLMLFASFFGMTAVLPLVVYMIRIITPIGGGDGIMGVALFLMGASELPAAFLFTKLHKKHSSHHLLIMSLFFCFLKVIAFALAPNVPVFLAVQLIQMLGYGIFTPSSVFFVNETVAAEDKVKGQTLMMAFSNGMGGTMGSLVGGWALNSGGVSRLLWLLGILGAISLTLAFLSLKVKVKGSDPVNA